MTDNPREADRVSLYIRVTASLRSRLGAGEWPVGSRLPTVDDLSLEYGVARVTVRHALQLLSQDGLVVSTRGRGTVVTRAASLLADHADYRAAINDRLQLSREDRVRILSRKIRADVPANMGPVEKCAPRYMQIEKIHDHRTEPFAVIDCIVELSAYRRFPRNADGRSKILKLLLERGGAAIAKGRQEITVTYADARIAGLLNCAIAAALVRVRSWRYDEKGVLIFGTDTLYRGDRFVFDVIEQNFSYDQASPLVIPAYRDPPE